jgi:hypothetical protein
MKEFNLVEYLIGAMNKGYLEGVEFLVINPSKILIKVYTLKPEHIRPVGDMLEANMIVNKKLKVKTVNRMYDTMQVETTSNTMYMIYIGYVGSTVA